jgi:hypothetical protein
MQRVTSDRERLSLVLGLGAIACLVLLVAAVLSGPVYLVALVLVLPGVVLVGFLDRPPGS